MIEALSAYTNEIDDVPLAVSEILEQVNTKRLLKNSIGILTCHMDFIKANIVKALCRELPFDAVGVNTLGSAVSENRVLSGLSLLVLTSDDVSFSAALSQPLRETLEAPVEAVRRSVLESLSLQCRVPENCALVLTFVPNTRRIGGNEILRVLNEVFKGVPLFGILPFDYTMPTRVPLVLFNGESYDDRLAVVLLSGNIHPRFATVSISGKNVIERTAVVTDSEKNILNTVNDMPAVAYLETLGLAENGQIQGADFLPLVIDCKDGTRPVAAIVLEQLSGGRILLNNSAPVNSTLGIGAIGRSDVLASIPEITGIAKKDRTNVVFFFSSVLRNFALGLDNMAEIERVQAAMGVAGRDGSVRDGSVPYLFAYSGGEICPLYTQDGRTVNRFHSMTAVACAF